MVPVGVDVTVLKLSNVEPYPLSEHVLKNYAALNVHVKYLSLYNEGFYAAADLESRCI